MTMLYKPGTMYALQDGTTVDYIVVEPEDIDAKLAEGWFLTTDECFAPPVKK